MREKLLISVNVLLEVDIETYANYQRVIAVVSIAESIAILMICDSSYLSRRKALDLFP